MFHYIEFNFLNLVNCSVNSLIQFSQFKKLQKPKISIKCIFSYFDLIFDFIFDLNCNFDNCYVTLLWNSKQIQILRCIYKTNSFSILAFTTVISHHI